MYSAGHADIMKHKKDVGGESMLTLDMVREAQEALRGIARRTPLDRAPKFGENVYIKAENLQLTGAFKLRGAYNKIRSLTPEEAARGVIAFAVKQLKPDCRIVGVQAAGAASMYLSRHAGGPTELRSVSTIADGIAVKKPGDLTFALCQQYVDEVVTVSEDEIASAILALMEGQKTVAEGAGAVPVAAVMFGKVDTSEKKTVCVVSGGNVDVTTLSRIITKGLSKAGRIAEISTKVADKPGSLLQLLKVVADSGANILSINHAREDQHSDVGACMVSMVLETRDAAHVEQIRRELTAMGYELEKE